MRVLVVKTSSMGDIIHTLPALTDAMQVFPDIRFDWVVEENFTQVPSWHPAVDCIIPIALRRWRKRLHDRTTYQEWRLFTASLRKRQYDKIIDAQGLLKSALLVLSIAKGIKHGMDRASLREPIAHWWYDVVHSVSREQNAVQRLRQLFALSLGYPTPTASSNYAITQHFLTQPLHSVKSPYLLFLHATTRTNKCWPAEYWKQLIHLVAPTGLIIKLPWGSELERQSALQLAQGFKHVVVLEKQSLTQMGHLLLGAKAIVSVDTGLSHLAAALNCPSIVLYGPTDPTLLVDYSKKQQICWAKKTGQMSDIAPAHLFSLLFNQDKPHSLNF